MAREAGLVHALPFLSYSNTADVSHHQIWPGMIYGLLADLVLAIHTLFVVFVVLGGLVALRWRRAVFVHVPCALWEHGSRWRAGSAR